MLYIGSADITTLIEKSV